MNRSERAKIFIPFNPLHGFTEALREKEEERERIDAPLVSTDRAAEIDTVLSKLSIGSEVEVVFYEGGKLRKLRGIYEKIEDFDMNIWISGTKIQIKFIFELSNCD